MKAIKLSQEEFKRSLNSNKVDHLWIYNKSINDKKIHNNGISLNKWNGRPQICIVLDRDSKIQDRDIERMFGKGSFINGAVSPDDKEQMVFDTYYISKK